VVPPEVTYATVHKEREDNRVVQVSTRVVFGTAAAVALALVASAVSDAVNTGFVERHNGTDRNRCSRKVRKTYGFSKDWDVHKAATEFGYFSYNFCWPVRTLRTRGDDGRWRKRTPAMAAGLTDHVWSVAEWLRLPAVQRKWDTTRLLLSPRARVLSAVKNVFCLPSGRRFEVGAAGQGAVALPAGEFVHPGGGERLARGQPARGLPRRRARELVGQAGGAGQGVGF
jgi:hypothetical protein